MDPYSSGCLNLWPQCDVFLVLTVHCPVTLETAQPRVQSLQLQI